MHHGRITSSGVFVGHTAKIGLPRTYVVLGVPRGGTSMCAGALRLAGISMGAEITPENEDRDFISHQGDIQVLEKPERKAEYLSRIKEVISVRNGNHDVWGWKDPISALYLEDIIQHLRNPHLILVMRDPMAVAMREWFALPQSHLSSASPNFYFDHIQRTLLLYSRLEKIVRETSVPGLILSYERCLRYPEDFAKRILAFSGSAEGRNEHENDLLEKIAFYVKPDAVSGRISSEHRDDKLDRSLRSDLSFYSSIEDAYRACADLVNTGNYADAVALSSSMLIAGIDGGRSAPQFVCSTQRFAVIEAGLCFIRAVAFTNTADPARAVKELMRFNAARDYLHKYGIHDALVEDLRNPVAKLQQSLETLTFRDTTSCP